MGCGTSAVYSDKTVPSASERVKASFRKVFPLGTVEEVEDEEGTSASEPKTVSGELDEPDIARLTEVKPMSDDEVITSVPDLKEIAGPKLVPIGNGDKPHNEEGNDERNDPTVTVTDTTKQRIPTPIPRGILEERLSQDLSEANSEIGTPQHERVSTTERLRKVSEEPTGLFASARSEVSISSLLANTGSLMASSASSRKIEEDLGCIIKATSINDDLSQNDDILPTENVLTAEKSHNTAVLENVLLGNEQESTHVYAADNIQDELKNRDENKEEEIVIKQSDDYKISNNNQSDNTVPSTDGTKNIGELFENTTQNDNNRGCDEAKILSRPSSVVGSATNRPQSNTVNGSNNYDVCSRPNRETDLLPLINNGDLTDEVGTRSESHSMLNSRPESQSGFNEQQDTFACNEFNNTPVPKSKLPPLVNTRPVLSLGGAGHSENNLYGSTVNSSQQDKMSGPLEVQSVPYVVENESYSELRPQTSQSNKLMASSA